MPELRVRVRVSAASPPFFWVAAKKASDPPALCSGCSLVLARAKPIQTSTQLYSLKRNLHFYYQLQYDIHIYYPLIPHYRAALSSLPLRSLCSGHCAPSPQSLNLRVLVPPFPSYVYRPRLFPLHVASAPDIVTRAHSLDFLAPQARENKHSTGRIDERLETFACAARRTLANLSRCCSGR